MTTNQYRHWTVEHLWRLLRAFLLLTGTYLWLQPQTLLEWSIFGCFILAAIVDQFHGYICNRIERMLQWKEDFNDWE